MSRLSGLFLLSAALLPTLLSTARSQDAPLPVGQPAPPFATTTVDGKPLSLKSLRGQVVLLDMWATWCGPCRMATPMLQSLHRKFGQKGLKVVGFSVDDTPELVKPFQKQMKLTYTMAASPDVNPKVALAYNAGAVPDLYLIDQKGIVRWCKTGFDAQHPAEEEQMLAAKIKVLLANGTTIATTKSSKISRR